MIVTRKDKKHVVVVVVTKSDKLAKNRQHQPQRSHGNEARIQSQEQAQEHQQEVHRCSHKEREDSC